MHAHIIPRACFDINESKAKWPILVVDGSGIETIQDYRRKGMAVNVAQMCDPEARIKTMEESDIDMQILSAPPSLMYYDIDIESSLTFSRKMNDNIAEIVRNYPRNFQGMASVPLQDPKIAADELDRAVSELGLKGVEILSNVNGLQLDWPDLAPFFEKAEKLNVPIFIHPYNVAGLDRMKKYYFANFIGNPVDTALAAAHIIFGGVLDKFPKLKICLSHAGGVLPYIIGRWDHGYNVRPEAKTEIHRLPSSYLRSFYFDTIAHSTTTLEFLIASMGADRVILGTDYPFDMADSYPVESVSKVIKLSKEDRSSILGGNVMVMFDI
ncbi:MAG: amidohydrolase family protein [Mobilitalea sp.]